MKIAFTADVHLRSPEETPERYHALEEVMRRCGDLGVEDLVIAGDLFDKAYPNYAAFEARCREHPELRIHLIPGNHDPGLAPHNFVAETLRVYDAPVLETIAGIDLALVPYAPDTTMAEPLAELLPEAPERPWLLVGHGDYYGGVQERNPLEPGTYMPLARKDVEGLGPRHVVLGHIHKPIRHGRVHYTGSPCGLDISETGIRSFLLLDTDALTLERIEIETDVIYLQERFLILPGPDEVGRTEAEVETRRRRWDLSDRQLERLRLRVDVRGYAHDRQAVVRAVEEGFADVTFADAEGPRVEALLTSEDDRLNMIAEQVRRRVGDLDWPEGTDEPGHEEIMMEALEVIYGS